MTDDHESRAAEILGALLAPIDGVTHAREPWCAASAAVVAVTGASISIIAEPPVQQLTLCASDDTADFLEELQFTRGSGPCFDAFMIGSPVLVPDLTDAGLASRWPAFSADAVDGGIGAVYAFPLVWGESRLGVIDFYRDRAGTLSAANISDGLIVADLVCLSLLEHGEYADEDTLLVDWAPHDRTEVYQATGMLMARLGVTADEALVRMRARAHSADLMIKDVADGVMSGAVDISNE